MDNNYSWDQFQNKCFMKHSMNVLMNIDNIKKKIITEVGGTCIICVVFDKNVNLQYVSEYIKKGFNNPLVHEKKYICLHFDPSLKVRPSFDYTMNRFLYTQSIITSSSCTINVSFQQDCIDFLRTLVDTKDHEIGGSFYPTQIINRNGKIVYNLKIHKINLGEHRRVKVTPTLFNFHTHPRSEYKNIKFAWPSSNDVIGFSNLYEKNTIIHFVVTVEGIYTISASSSCFLKRDRRDIEQDVYNFDYKRNSISPKQYIKEVGQITHSCNGRMTPMFQIKFYDWNEITPYTIFESCFQKTNGQCIGIPSINESFTLKNI